MYNLPENYISRTEPAYFEDILTDSSSWQADVYRLAAKLARESGINRLADIGCGRGEKLLSYGDEFKLTGIDYGNNIQYLMNRYPQGDWINADLNSKTIPTNIF